MELRRAGCWVFSLCPSLPASVPTENPSAFSILESQAQGGRQASRVEGHGGQEARSLEGLPLKQLVQKAEAVGGGDLPRLRIHYS